MISIQTNLDSLIAQQNLSVNNAFQSNTIQQLTSGYRINSSSDDAAGLSVANGYRNQIAELNQGVLNANQGVSQLQIIDGGLSNISQMLDRLQTLATESASTTFTGNRQTLDTEYQGLLTEIGRQADNIGLGDNNASNAIDLGVYIGGGQSAEANSSVNVNLTGKSVSATGLGLAGTSVLTTQPVAIGTVPAQLIAPLDVDTFNVQTASGFHQITLEGKSGDTLQGQVNELNAQMTPNWHQCQPEQPGHSFNSSPPALSQCSAVASNSANQAFDLVDSVNGGTGPDVGGKTQACTTKRTRRWPVTISLLRWVRRLRKPSPWPRPILDTNDGQYHQPGSPSCGNHDRQQRCWTSRPARRRAGGVNPSNVHRHQSARQHRVHRQWRDFRWWRPGFGIDAEYTHWQLEHAHHGHQRHRRGGPESGPGARRRRRGREHPELRYQPGAIAGHQLLCGPVADPGCQRGRTGR
jgi:flagellin-like hook-associated protein FlgL